jgi:uncharacterized membrane protein YqgA involved in biofilm formation
VTGAILNAAGIVAGGIVGLVRAAPLKPATQSFFKAGLGVFTVFFGLRLTWLSVNGPFLQILKQLAIVMLAVMLGKLAGRLLHFQKASNRLGQFARNTMERAKPGAPQRFIDGFSACTALFCAAPLGILGAVQDGLPVDGLARYTYTLAIKAVMDALATMSFVRMFGWSAMLSAVPVLVIQGSVTLACNLYLEPFLRTLGPVNLVDSVNAVGGLLVCTVGLVIFEFKKVELADYLPSLALAPLLTWLWK